MPRADATLPDIDLAAVPRLALRPDEAAAALGISPRKLWSITADRTSAIPHVRLGKAVVYPTAELAAWLAERTTTKTR